jgi:predicted  nucleic acid-binding Zn-ribbon protein
MPINATATDLPRLLDLQTEDSTIKRLHERKSSLPEAEQLQSLNEQIAELTSDIEIATRQNAEVGRDQDKLEGEIEIAESKITREEQRMFSGNVANPKELSALQAEVEMLKRKKGELEDQLLEVMVAKESAAATLERLEGERARATTDSERLTKQVAMLENDIQAQLAEHEGRRTEISRDIPDDILKLYEQIRATKGGIGAAALEAGTCQGCHTKLPNKEVERLKAEGGLQRCENCRRILIVS